MALPTINSFWHGPALGPMEAACLSSFVRHGHPVVLHCYEAPAEVPAGVAVRDAAAVLPRTSVEGLLAGRHFAIASDLVRYEILGAGLGIWVDCDCYCLRPLADEPYIMGWESDGAIAIGVLKLPADSELLTSLRKIREGFIPPWVSRRRKITWTIRRLVGQPKPLARMPWGTTGPAALTYYARQLGVDGLAKPAATFYPVPWWNLDPLFNERLTIEEAVSPETVVLHLYNEKLRDRAPPPPNSPLGRILAGFN